MNKKQRLLIIGGVIFFGLLIIVSLFFYVLQSQKGRLVTASTPSDLTLLLDGQPIAPTGQVFIEPGKHELTARRNAFAEKKIPFEIAKGETKEIAVYIFPEGGAGEEWVRQNPNEASELDGLVSNEYEEESQRVFNDYPILRQLPITERTFTITQGESKTGKPFALNIRASDQEARDAALATLRFYGYDPGVYEINYITP